jgi:hypothetical protein
MPYERTHSTFLAEVEKFLKIYFREYDRCISVTRSDEPERYANFDSVGRVSAHAPHDSYYWRARVESELVCVRVPEVPDWYGSVSFRAGRSTIFFRFALDGMSYWLVLIAIQNEIRRRFPIPDVRGQQAQSADD